MKLMPNDVKSVLKKWFGYPEREIYCQLASTSSNRPHLRTMRLYEITASDELILLSRTDSQKWRDLKGSPYFATTFLNIDFGQIVAEGVAKLISGNEPERLKYWMELEPMFQEIYLFDLHDQKSHTIPESFGVIKLHPELWEVLALDKQDYLKSSRKQWTLQKGQWEEKTFPPV